MPVVKNREFMIASSKKSELVVAYRKQSRQKDYYTQLF